MSFVTITFALFLAVVFGLHWAAPRAGWQRTVLLLASYFFYGWWDWRFCGLMLISGMTGFFVAKAMSGCSSPVRRRHLLWISLTVELGILGFFKYFNFFADSFVLGMAALGFDVSTTTFHVVLPVGISFYTFQSLAYVIDVYRGREAERDPVLYLLYLSFFPQLVAGPIERAGDLLGQLREVRRFDSEAAVDGCRLILWGLVKKMVFADRLGGISDEIFARGADASAPEIMLGTVAFAFQIYGDFSGYSDMAAGIASLFGVRLSRNFCYPYFARDLADFWRRWHVTLSSWLRDYVFIPLGGSRGPLRSTLRNILLTFLASGLWHGAAWHYVVWGIWHAVGLGLQLVVGKFQKPGRPRLPLWLSGSLLQALRAGATFLYVCLGWIWFRASDVGEGAALFEQLFTGWNESALASLKAHTDVFFLLVPWVGIEWLGGSRWNPIAWERIGRGWRWLGYTAVLGVIVLFDSRRNVEFIYFQF